jgi:outer membrane protein
MKKAILIGCLGLGFVCFSVSGQQITRFAVVDMNKVYAEFFKESKAVRDFEEKSKKIQSEIDKMTKEIQDLQIQLADASSTGDDDKAMRLEADIEKKANFLREYHRLKTAELVEQRNKLSSSSDFLGQVQNELRFVAESEGYTMVLNLNDNKGILWYSQSVDLTDKLINSLKAKARR